MYSIYCSNTINQLRHFKNTVSWYVILVSWWKFFILTVHYSLFATDFIWLHIRCAGGWTNKLYEYFEQEQSKQLLRTNNAKNYNDNNKYPKAVSAIEPTSVDNESRSKYISHCIPMPSGMPIRQQPCTVSASLPIVLFKNSPSNPRKMKLTPRASHAPETVAKDSAEVIQSHQPPMREEQHIFHSLEV